MKLNRRAILRAYAPFRKEALISLAIDAAAMLLYAGVMAACGALKADWRCWLVLPAYVVVACLVHYRIALLSVVEQRRGMTVSDTVVIHALKEDYSASGHWGSMLSELAPKKVRLARTAFVCTDGSGKRLRLRRVTVSRNLQLLGNAIHRDGSVSRRVTYGKMTHIILAWDDDDAMAVELNRAYEGLT